MIKLFFSVLQICMLSKIRSIGSDQNSELQKSSSLEDLIIDNAQENVTISIDLLSFLQFNKDVYLLNKAVEIRLHIFKKPLYGIFKIGPCQNMISFSTHQFR